MKHPLRSVAIWLVMLATGIAAFTLTLNITSNNIENSDVGSGVEIDLNQNPYEAATTQENVSLWEKYRRSQEETDETQESATTASADETTAAPTTTQEPTTGGEATDRQSMDGQTGANENNE